MSALALSALVGWALAGGALGAVSVLRRRLRLVARAEHELRGPVTVLALAAERLRRDRAAFRHALALESELARLCQGLDDLAAARHGGRSRPGPAAAPAPLEAVARSAVAGWAPVLRRQGRAGRFRWEPGPQPVDIPRGRAAQALGNLLANAAEHGEGDVELSGRRTDGGVRVEVRSAGRPARSPASGRGHGLSIVREAAEEAGGSMQVEADGDATVVSLDLPHRRSAQPSDPEPAA